MTSYGKLMLSDWNLLLQTFLRFSSHFRNNSLFNLLYVHSNTSHSITQGSHASIPADSELWMQSSLLPLMKASCTLSPEDICQMFLVSGSFFVQWERVWKLWCFSSAEFKVVLFQFNLVQKDAIQCVWRGLTPQLIEHLASTINDHTLYDVVCRLKRNMSHQGR